MRTNFISSSTLGRDVPLSEVAEWIKGGMRLKDAAEKLGVARQRLSQRFHRDLGLTAQEMQRQVREAKQRKQKPKTTIPNDCTIVIHLTPGQKQKVLSTPGTPQMLREWIDALPPGTKDPGTTQRAKTRNNGLDAIWNVKVTKAQLAKSRTIDQFRPKVREWIDNLPEVKK